MARRAQPFDTTDTRTVFNGSMWVPGTSLETRVGRRRRRARARRRRIAGFTALAVAMVAVPAVVIPLLLAAIRV
ncbi:MAG TPA: hypothetical protein VFA83_11310 [Acidimicrobiales bacterium]|nr:hypothetical protein [Acidimicrobiales bacterium]